MSNTNFKGVLFDLDGTLADNYTAIHKCTCAAFEKFGIPAPTYERVFTTVGGSILITMKRLLADTPYADLYEKTADYYLQIYPDFVFCGLKAMPYAHEVMAELKSRGIKMACFTNKQRSGAEAVAEKLGFDKFFDCIVATSLHSPRKPDREFTQTALREIGLPAAEVLGVGDSPFDYLAAENASVKSALVATGGDSKASLLEKCPNALGIFDDLKGLSAAVLSVEI